MKIGDQVKVQGNMVPQINNYITRIINIDSITGVHFIKIGINRYSLPVEYLQLYCSPHHLNVGDKVKFIGHTSSAYGKDFNGHNGIIDLMYDDGHVHCELDIGTPTSSIGLGHWINTDFELIKVEPIAGCHCSKCNFYNEYQTEPFICYSCKNGY